MELKKGLIQNRLKVFLLRTVAAGVLVHLIRMNLVGQTSHLVI